MSTLLLLWANPLFRKLAAIVGIILLFVIFVISVRHHWIDLGQQQGEQKANQETNKAQGADVKAATENVIPKLEILTQQIITLQQDAKSDRQMFLTLAMQRQQIPSQVAAMSPDQVKAFVYEALGKKPTDIINDSDMRQFADCFKQKSVCDDQLVIQNNELEKLRKSDGDQTARFDTLLSYNTTVLSAYKDLYSRAMRPEPSWKCLRLWRCSKPKLNVPDPEAMLNKSPIKVKP